MGSVYVVRDEIADRLVALKLLRGERFDAAAIRDLQSEFRAFADLRHPQIAAAYDFGYTDDLKLPYYTREYVEGSQLAPGPTRGAPPDEFLRPLLDLLDALQYLHTHEILHLDVHAGNLIVASDLKRGSVLIDFGVAGRIRQIGSSALLAGRVSLPPEIIAGAEPGAAADVFSAGRLLLFRLTGYVEGGSQLLREIPGWNPRLTLQLERIAAKALQSDPARRFRTAGELRDALVEAIGSVRGKPRRLEPADLTIGRLRELEAIDGVLAQALEKKPSVLCFTGNRGSGKSRLLTEARRRAQLLGLNLVEARFHDFPSGEAPLILALKALSRGGERSSSWLRALTIDQGGSTFERARRAAKACLAVDGSPLVLLLDDFENADKESRVLAEALARECSCHTDQDGPVRGVAFIIAGSSAAVEQLAKASGSCRVLKLRPFKANESLAMLIKLLRPLEIPKPLARLLCRAAAGNPLRLRKLAQIVRDEHSRAGTLPTDASALLSALDEPRSGRQPWVPAPPEASPLLKALAAIRRAARADELAAACERPLKNVQALLRRCVEDEVLAKYKRGKETLFGFRHSDDERDLAKSLSASLARRVHQKLARHLRDEARRNAAAAERRARHLLACGRRREGRSMVISAAAWLRRQRQVHAAARLLSDALAGESSQRWKLRFAEELSVLHQQAGDHEEGVRALEPIRRGELGRLRAADAVRLRRRLGVHYHRAGFANEASAVFEEVRRLAHPRRDVEELIFVESELAELHTLRGEYRQAQAACRRGLDLLAGAAAVRDEFRGSMEVLLRASLGHLELRRMDLDRAKRELEAALRLARSSGSLAIRALILHNLGIVHNQQNDLAKARHCYRCAARILARLGDHGGVIHAECNLATAAAKAGDAAAARSHLAAAERLHHQCPGKRLEFSVALARGMVSHTLGDLGDAGPAFEKAISLGRELGDLQHASFAELYLAEVHLASGLLGDALARLAVCRKAGRRSNSTLLERMALSRLCFAEALIGRENAAQRWRRAFEEVPRTACSLPEAWNDLFAAAAQALVGEATKARCELEAAENAFAKLCIPVGQKLARLGLCYEAIARGASMGELRDLLLTATSARERHRLLSILTPIANAEVHLMLGNLDSTESALEEAASAIVGVPCIELDGRIELIHGRLAEKRGDREAARRYLQRSLHTLELSARSLPLARRANFLSHRRFAGLRSLTRRLERPVVTPALKIVGPSALESHGIVFRSAPMMRVIEMVERLADQEVPVLIRGETGTGKELVARAIHRTGARQRGAFLVLHCASLPFELFESELLGHEAGAFTGADAPRTGILEANAGGTILLDEVSHLAQPLQAKLLGIIESKVIRPLGAMETRPIDVRFLASSSADLPALVESGAFRADLYYRLAGVEISLPPLRARKEDIAPLAVSFLEIHARRLERPAPALTPDALVLLESHAWPGNVRELESVLLRALVMRSPADRLDAEAFRRLIEPRTGSPPCPAGSITGRSLSDLRNELDRTYLTQLFQELHGDVAKMAAKLEVKTSRLYDWLRRVKLDIRALRRGLARQRSGELR